MHNLIIPMAGFGNRFADLGYTLPKQFLNLNGMTCLERSLSSIDCSGANVILLARRQYLSEFPVDDLLTRACRNAKSLTCKGLDTVTRGSLETCLEAAEYLDLKSPTSVFTLDVQFTPQVRLEDISFGSANAIVFTIKTNNKGFSYIKVDEQGTAVQVEEKNRISEYGISGLYSFQDTGLFLQMARSKIEQGLGSSPEFFIAPLFNEYIRNGLIITKVDLSSLIMFGTPREYEYVRTYCRRELAHGTTIGVASDHSGYYAKELFKKVASRLGLVVFDYGCYSPIACDYPDFVSVNAAAIVSREVTIGLSFCHSGQGVNIAASRRSGIVSVIAYSISALSLALAHNNPNHIAIPSFLADEQYLKDVVDQLFQSKFEGGRHQDRLMKVMELTSHGLQ